MTSAAADTFHLAWYDFENAGMPDTQGWTSVDITAQIDTFFHVADSTELDGGDFDRLIVIEGEKSMWCGQVASALPPFCDYATLPGYGNGWHQSLFSKVFECDSMGLYFEVIWDSEPSYDFTVVEYYDGVTDTWTQLSVGSGGGSYYDGWSTTIECFMFGTPAGSTQVRFVFTSDGAWSDEDGIWPTDGAIIIDSITVDCFNDSVLTATYYEDFEDEAVGAHVTDDGCWTAGTPVPFGDFAALYPGASVLQTDPCWRNTSWLWGFFDDPNITNYSCHTPDPQPLQGAIRFGPNETGFYMNNEIWSPWIANSGTGNKYRLIFDVYRDLPLDNLIYYVWHVRSITGGCPGQWRDYTFGWIGRDWGRLTHDVSALLDPGADYFQIALGTVDMCPFWCLVFGTGSCHSQGPLFDNVHLERINTAGPQYFVRHLDLFQDTFAGDGTLTGTARADAANDIRTTNDPLILPGDSILVTVDDETSGMATDPHTGWGSAVYTYVAVWPQGQAGKSGPELESAHVRIPPQGSPLGKRFPLVDSLTHDGATWYCFRMDTAFTVGGGVINRGQTRCFDLNDSVFTPGDTICYVFCAENTIAEKRYWSRRLDGAGLNFTTDDLWEALGSPLEFQVLPGGGWNAGGDILYVDAADDRGGPPQLFFDTAFDVLGLLDKVDRYDVNAPSSNVGNSLGSRLANSAVQLNSCHQKIFWCSANLSSGIVGDGGTQNGGSSAEKSNDWTPLFNFVDLGTNNKGIYFSGDDLAQDWITLIGGSAVAFRSAYMDFALAGSAPGDHVASGEPVSPCLVAVGPCFIHFGQPDSLIAYGGCTALNDFDILTPLQGQTEFENPTTGADYVISQATENAVGDTSRVILSGFSYHYIRNKRPGFPDARTEHLRDIITWLRNEAPTATGVKVAAKNELRANYPNPFNPTTTITYNVRQTGHVTLRVYNVAGQLVKTLVDDVRAPAAGGGLHNVIWYGETNTGEPAASGVYFYKIVAQGFTQTKKMVLLK